MAAHLDCQALQARNSGDMAIQGDTPYQALGSGAVEQRSSFSVTLSDLVSKVSQ